MEQIIVIPKGSLSAKDKGKLEKKGHIVIETNDPDSIRFISPANSKIETNDLLMAALHALDAGADNISRGKFVVELNRRLKDNETKK